MRIGIVPPVLVQHPATRADWEQGAGIAEVSTIAETADRLGYHHITCSEHVAIPVDVATERGGTYWDPLSTLGFLAARTRRIRLATQVLVLGYHHPLEIAKRYGTLDQLSKGRVILGLGVGSLREEFELIGAQFEGRGSLADDAIGALRASMSQAVPTASTTRLTALWWNPTPRSPAFHCGSAGVPSVHCGGPCSTVTAGCPSGSAWMSWPP